MPTDIKLGDLASRAIRASTTPGGIKRIALNQYKEARDEQGGLLGLILDIGGKFFGFVSKALFGAVQWGLSTLWQWICRAVQYVWTFDWAQSDESMDKSLESSWNAFGGILGGAFGGTLGWLVPGAIAGAFMFKFNVPMAIHVLNEFGEEALQEISQHAAAVLNASKNLLGKALFNWSYQAARNFLIGKESDIYLSDEEIEKRVLNGTMTPNTAVKNKKGREAMKQEFQRKPWSFALKFEEWRESIPSEFWKNFVEEAWEEFWEAFQEAGTEICIGIEGFHTDAAMAVNNGLVTLSGSHVATVDLNRS